MTSTTQPTPAAIPYVLEQGEGELIRWFGATLTIKASGPGFDVALATQVAGSEPPFHLHAHEDEALHVLHGRLTVFAGAEVLSAPAGAFVFLPRGVPHTFAVDSGTAHLLVVLGPAGAIAGYGDVEQRFGRRGMPARPHPADLELAAEALAPYGITVTGPNPRHADGRTATANPHPERSRP